MALKTMFYADAPATTLFLAHSFIIKTALLVQSCGRPLRSALKPKEIIEGVTAGTGLSGGGSAGTVSLALDLADVIATDAANRLLTSDGDGSLTAEANITYDGSTFTIDDDMMIKDDHKLFFGTNSDSFIEYNEDQDDFMVISGSGNGIVLSGSAIGNAGFTQLTSVAKLWMIKSCILVRS